MKAIKVIVGLILVAIGGWLIFVAFWNGMWLTHASSPGASFYLPFFISILCLSSGFSIVDRATGFKRRREERKMLRQRQAGTATIGELLAAEDMDSGPGPAATLEPADQLAMPTAPEAADSVVAAPTGLASGTPTGSAVAAASTTQDSRSPSDGSMGPRKSWWGRRRKGAKVALVFAGVIVLAALAGGLTPLVVKALRLSDVELVQTLMTTADTGDRHEAAVDLAARHSLQATQDLGAAAATDTTAREGLAALRDEYIARFAVSVEWQTLEEREAALKETAQCLGMIGDATSIDALGNISCSYGQQRTSVRVSAVRALAQTKTTTALPHLIQAIMLSSSADPTGEVGNAASAGVLLMPEAPAALIRARAENAGNASACSAIEEILVQIGEPAVPPLVAQLGSVDWADEVLTEIGTPAIAAVDQELDSQEAIVRYRALGVLLRLYQQDKTGLTSHLVLPKLVPLLIEARSQAQYGDERDTTAEVVLAAIGESAVQPLVALLGGTAWADDVLAEIGAAVIPVVSQELGNDEPIVRYRALGVLLRLYAADKDAVTPELVQPDMVPLLIEARNKAGYGDDRDADTAAVLAEIGEPAAKSLVPLIGSGDWVEDALLNMGDPAVPALVATLNNKDGNIAWGAARVLASMYRTKPEFVKGLMAALDDENLKTLARNFTFYLTIGKAGTEDVLIRALNAYGTSRMCLEFYTCGNATLEAAAKKWASRHSATLSVTGSTSLSPQWGKGLDPDVTLTRE